MTILTPGNFGMPSNEQMQAQMGADIQRLAVGMDMLVGLLSEHWGYDLEETKNDHGNIVLRWRPRGAETPESESKEPSDS